MLQRKCFPIFFLSGFSELDSEFLQTDLIACLLLSIIVWSSFRYIRTQNKPGSSDPGRGVGLRSAPVVTSQDIGICEVKPKIVTDHKKAFCQMIRFSIRFRRKLNKIRERKRLEHDKGTLEIRETFWRKPQHASP